MSYQKKQQTTFTDFLHNKRRLPVLHTTLLETLFIFFGILTIGAIAYLFTSVNTDTQTTHTTSTQASQRETDRYNTTNPADTAGQDTMIIGGAPVEDKNSDGNEVWPFVANVSISYLEKDGDIIQKNCTGSLIDSKWILTAAHCVVRTNDIIPKIPLKGRNITVRIGSNNIGFNGEYKKIPVKNIHIPNVYINTTDIHDRTQSDIALIELDEIVSLPTISLKKYTLYTGNPVIKIGWGYVEEGKKTNYLHESISLFYNRDDIIQRLPGIYTVENSLHTFPEYACVGDSGGPLIGWNSIIGRIELLGVASIISSHPDPNSIHTTEGETLRKIIKKGQLCTLPDGRQHKGGIAIYTSIDYHRKFIINTLEYEPTGTFIGKPIDQYHCDISDSGMSFDDVGECGIDYFIRRGCNDTCIEGYRNCLYGLRYIGCEQDTGGSTGTYDSDEPKRSSFSLPTEKDSDTLPQEETPPEQEPREQGEQPQNPNLTTYWDKECVCTDGAEYKSLRDLPETNDEGRCNSNEFVALCTQTYPGVFNQAQLQTYWDVECVQTDGTTYTAVDATQCE